MRHLDIDNILGAEERLPCTFHFDVEGLGYLDPSLSADLPAESKVSLPLWMAQNLSQKGAVTVELPKHFGRKMRNEIRAGPAAVKLREFSFHFFDVGLRLSRIKSDDDLLTTLREALSGDRFKQLVVRALSSGWTDSAEYCQQLTSFELAIYKEGHAVAEDISAWRSNRTSRLRCAPIIDTNQHLSTINT